MSRPPRPPRSHRRLTPRPSRVIGWLAAGLLLFVVLSWPGLARFQSRLLALAQRDGPAHLPAVVNQAELPVPDQPSPEPTATAPEPGGTPPPWPPPTGPDALGEALASLGMTRDALGYRPRGDWTRFPLPERTPYLLPMFEPLFDDPFRIYAAARTMGNAAARFLHPSAIGPDGSGGLLGATYHLGMDRRVGNFRDYGPSANLHADPADADPLREAVRDIYLYANEETAHYLFGAPIGWQNIEALLDRQLEGVPPPLQETVARALLNQLDAMRWRDRGLRRVEPELARRVFAIRDLGDTQGDGTVYYPEIDDLVGQLDEPSLYFGARKAVDTADRLRRELAALEPADRCPPQTIDVPTPFGRVVVGTCEHDTHEGADVLLSVDPGGDDTHLDNAGGTASIEIPVAIAVDLAGNDRYDCTALERGGCQGAGVLGHGVLLDAAGDDAYVASTHAQGAGYLGQGVLLDVAGQDTYDARFVAQGAAFFGHGLLADGDGDDTYDLWWDGQGYGGVGGGVGVLADQDGDDRYTAEPDVRALPEAFRYRNYGGNGQPNTNVSFAQGASAGRRGDVSDGHSWPGGLGALVDVAGHDRYRAGAFAQGYGYWYGVGWIYDGGGDDDYESVYYSIASGAHYSASALIDEGGNDRYRQVEDIPESTAGAGVAFAWDFVNALLFDRAGDDHYESKVNCLARSAEKGNAFLIDAAGDDTYVGGAGRGNCVASSAWRGYMSGHPYLTYITGHESNVFSLLLDLGGADTYLEKDFETGQLAPHPRAADGTRWTNPDPEATTGTGDTYAAARVFGLGVDRPDGAVPDLSWIPPWPTPQPGGDLRQHDLDRLPDRGPLVPAAPPRDTE